MHRYKNKKLLISLLFVAILVAAVLFAKSNKTPNPVAASSSKAKTSSVQSAFNKNQYPLDTASSLWVVVNKGRALPSDYAPANLSVPSVPLRLSASSPEMHVRSDTAAALQTMFAAAKPQGLSLMLASGYRSYSQQVSVYSSYVASSGVQKADTFSARPGHSEHQTGLAADLEPASRTCEVDQCFENTPEGQWLATNAYKYGFIIRYQKTTQSLTGYEYEPWHVRYVGVDLAGQLYQSSQTLEQFFGLPIYTDYPSQSLQLKDE